MSNTKLKRWIACLALACVLVVALPPPAVAAIVDGPDVTIIEDTDPIPVEIIIDDGSPFFIWLLRFAAYSPG